MHWREHSRFYLILALCLSTVACAPALFWNYGRITPNWEVTMAFEGYQSNPDFRYYISGSDFKPIALMGLDKTYRLDPSTTWKEVDMSPVRMQQIVEDMNSRSFIHKKNLHGFEMSDQNGRPIGVWYSVLEARTFLRMNNDGTVRIDTPDR